MAWVKFSDSGVLIKYRGSVLHTLIGRYMLSKSLSKREFKMILNHVSVGVS
ncbi:VOC family protein, partial [Vibrio parahaemolyticus]|nr:VOC family protein [Vibrio parahaemolyticus]